jgi:hypothetical protein
MLELDTLPLESDILETLHLALNKQTNKQTSILAIH